MAERKAILGHKVRRLRRDLRLTQAQMAEQLGISPSYLNLIENNQRALTVPLLIKLGQTFDVDLAAFAEDEEGRLVAGLREVLADPLFEHADVKGQDLKEVAAAAPALGQAFLTLYRAYREAREDLQGLAERVAGGDALGREGGGDRAAIAASGAFPQEEVGEAFQARGNHFPELEQAAEALWIDGDLDAADLYGSLSRYLDRTHGVRVRLMPLEVMGQTTRRFDRHSRRLLVSEMLPPSGRVFAVAGQVALLKHRDLLEGLVERAELASDAARRLLLMGLSSYFAAAVMMPYGRFLEAARTLRYDLEVLQSRFGVSFEQVSHRLTTLQRPGARGVPFFMIRVDTAGNVSKRFSADPGFHFARFGGACPRWNVHDAFRTPGRLHTQLAQMPDGTTYLSVARTVTNAGAGWKVPPRQFAIALGCDVQHAAQIVYADGLDLGSRSAATPIGVNCRLCPRLDCTQRAFPPLNHRLVVDEHVRGLSSYAQIGVG
ncbi:MAG TPA: short-chain fatty acyl-CoA regulator family protein [Azospirillaceae bacterium]|nr:short-chain fatty acyl-CoA regulator family protein [Azospirillaceae bacterium]